MSVTLSSDFGIVIRRAALSVRGVSEAQVLAAMQTEAPLASDGDLLSFGPHFGGEAALEFQRRLEALGLQAWDDFAVCAAHFPAWCRLSVELWR